MVTQEGKCRFGVAQMIEQPVAVDDVVDGTIQIFWSIQVQVANIYSSIPVAKAFKIIFAGFGNGDLAFSIKVVMREVADSRSHFKNGFSVDPYPQACQVLEPASRVSEVLPAVEMFLRSPPGLVYDEPAAPWTNQYIEDVAQLHGMAASGHDSGRQVTIAKNNASPCERAYAFGVWAGKQGTEHGGQ